MFPDAWGSFSKAVVRLLMSLPHWKLLPNESNQTEQTEAKPTVLAGLNTWKRRHLVIGYMYRDKEFSGANFKTAV